MHKKYILKFSQNYMQKFTVFKVEYEIIDELSFYKLEMNTRFYPSIFSQASKNLFPPISFSYLKMKPPKIIHT